MFIERFEVSGYRSIHQASLEDLQPITAFFGDNGVGKSNILRALELFGRLMATRRHLAGDGFGGNGGTTQWYRQMYRESEILSLGFGRDDFHRGQPPRITMQATVHSVRRKGSPFVVNVEIDPSHVPIGYVTWNGLDKEEVDKLKTEAGADGIFRIPSRRRLEVEKIKEDPGSHSSPDAEGRDLKRRLFWASVSPDKRLKDHFWKRFVPLLRDEPLSLGEPVAVGTSVESVDVRFVRDDMEVSVGELGSGVQQLLMILGMSTLCDARIIALEEPEMNLAWSRQQTLRGLLHRMVEGPGVGPDQVFLSSHSPIFAEDPYYDVTMENGQTKVVQRPYSELPYFGEDGAHPPAGESGKLLFRNFVRLPDSIVEHLALEAGQYLFFRREDRGAVLLNEEQMETYLAAEDEAPFDRKEK